MWFHEFRRRWKHVGAARGHRATHAAFFTSTVLFDELLQLGDRVNHMDSLAPIETSWLQNPNIFAREVTHGHDKPARL